MEAGITTEESCGCDCNLFVSYFYTFNFTFFPFLFLPQVFIHFIQYALTFFAPYAAHISKTKTTKL